MQSRECRVESTESARAQSREEGAECTMRAQFERAEAECRVESTESRVQRECENAESRVQRVRARECRVESESEQSAR